MVPVGAKLTRIYFAVRTSPYRIGAKHDTWDDAVIAAQAAYDDCVARLSAASPHLPGQAIAKTAKLAVYLETRWVMAWDRAADGVGGSADFMYKRHADVTVLRTQASFAVRPTLPAPDQVRNLSASEAVALTHDMNA